MCLLIYSPEGATLTEKEMSNAMLANPDGWGIVMYGGDVRKGTRLEAMLRAVKAAEGKPYMLHYRLATHGGTDVRNCHPFKVSDDLYLAHNGILPIPCKPGYSDTRTLAYGLRGSYVSLGQVEQAPWEAYLGIGNKVCFFEPSTGAAVICGESQGHWHKNGLWASNDGYTRAPFYRASFFREKAWTFDDDPYDYKGYREYETRTQPQETGDKVTTLIHTPGGDCRAPSYAGLRFLTRDEVFGDGEETMCVLCNATLARGYYDDPEGRVCADCYFAWSGGWKGGNAEGGIAPKPLPSTVLKM